MFIILVAFNYNEHHRNIEQNKYRIAFGIILIDLYYIGVNKIINYLKQDDMTLHNILYFLGGSVFGIVISICLFLYAFDRICKA